MKEFVLTKNEYEIMDLLWKEERSLSRSDIIELSTDRNWKKNSFFSLINSLLEKGALEIDGFVKSKTNYGRAFKPTLSADEYAIMQININRKAQRLSVPALVSGIIGGNIDISDIEELEKILQERKKELK